jgi:aspartyl/asparaginyl beta-hydroxylase (cupin superfamily)
MKQRYIYNSDDFPFLKPLEQNWHLIRQELLQVIDKMLDARTVDTEHYSHTITRGKEWSSVPIIQLNEDLSIHNPERIAHIKRWGAAYGDAQSFSLNAPLTCNLIKNSVPNWSTSVFVKLGANTKIRAHKGWTGSLYRAHLGLIVPEGDIKIQVEKSSSKWEEGKILVFDDNCLHRAWNKTNLDRYILSVDFKPE